MKTITKSLLCAGMAVVGGLSASAYNLISPAPGSTTEVTSLSQINLQWSENVQEPPTGTVTLLDSSNTQVAIGTPDFNWDAWDSYTVTFAPAPTTPGTYTVVVPANMAADNSNPEYKLTYVLVGGAAQSAEPTEITPAGGSAIVQGNGVEFNNIRFVFADAKDITINQSNLSFTYQDGTPVEYTLSGFYNGSPMLEFGFSPLINVEFNFNGDLPSGTYTLVANPGTFTAADGTVYMEKIELVYDYTKTKADRDETPLVIESALMGGATSTGSFGVYTYTWVGTDAVPVTTDMPVAEFVGMNNVGEGQAGTGFLLTFNHGDKSDYIEYFLLGPDGDIMTLSQCYKQEDGSFLLPWASTTKLYDNQIYTLEFHAYTNVQDKVENGDGATLTFKGISEGFKYSSAEFVTVVPVTGSLLNTVEERKITVLFSQPVKMTAKVSLGMGASEEIEAAPATEGNLGEYDNVWFAYIPEYIMLTYPDAQLSVVAYGEDGNIVRSTTNGSTEQNSNNSFFYEMTLCAPRIMTRQTNSNVPEISKFRVYSSKGNPINPSWVAFPYVVNERGETVAELNWKYQTDEWGDPTPFKVIKWSGTSEYDNDPLELEFEVTPAIKELGKYTLVCPRYAFLFGTQHDGEASIEQNMDYYVVNYFPVNYSVDNSTLALSPVEEGNNVTLDITTSEGWKLEALYCNGKDVTADVAGSKYESAPVYEAVNFVAEFSFDGVVLEPTGVDDVVSDLNLRGWSEGGKLFVAGLQAGQIVNIYTLGGSLMATAEVTSGNDGMSFAVATGTYIITVTDGDQTVALKLINK